MAGTATLTDENFTRLGPPGHARARCLTGIFTSVYSIVSGERDSRGSSRRDRARRHSVLVAARTCRNEAGPTRQSSWARAVRGGVWHPARNTDRLPEIAPAPAYRWLIDTPSMTARPPWVVLDVVQRLEHVFQVVWGEQRAPAEATYATDSMTASSTEPGGGSVPP